MYNMTSASFSVSIKINQSTIDWQTINFQAPVSKIFHYIPINFHFWSVFFVEPHVKRNFRSSYRSLKDCN